MIEQFINALNNTGVEFDDIDLADALWLAAAMMEPADIARPSDIAADSPVDSQLRNQQLTPPQETEDPERHPNLPRPSTPEVRTEPYAKPSGLVDSVVQQESIVAPTSAALPERLDIARALRPFKRRRASDHFVEFDEEATVRRYADTGFLYPVMRPGRERWFDVALVVDESMSMVVWEETVAELVKVFDRHGAFRDVHRWSLRERDGRAVVHNEMGLPTGTHNLVDPGGRRLVMMISDCVAEMWYRPRIWQLLQQWGKRTPVSILQMLPSRIWPATGLGSANIEMFGTKPGAPNSDQFAPLPFWLDATADGLEAIPVPAIGLNANAIGRWARVTMGAGTISSRAVVKTAVAGHYPTKSQDQTLSPHDRVEAFRINVPETVWQLTLYLSIVPLRLAVMRLIQEAMMPETGHSELAEFLIGGLVRRVSGEQRALNGSHIEFEFADGVREELNSAVGQTETLNIYRNLAQYLERTTGTAPGFSALILGQDIAIEAVPDSLRPFIKVSQGVLERVGIRPAKTLEESDVLAEFPDKNLGETAGEFQSEQIGSMLEDSGLDKDTQPVWDGALVVGVSHYDILDPLDDPAQTAAEFGDWLCSNPGPNMNKERVRVLRNPNNLEEIRAAFLALHETATRNPDQLFVIAMFGHTIKGPRNPLLCLTRFDPESPLDVFDYHALLDQLILGGAWDQYLCIVDGGPDDLEAAIAMDPFSSMRDRIVEASPGERQGLTLTRKTYYTENFLHTIIDAFNYKARDLDGCLRQKGLVDHLRDAVDVESQMPGLNVLLDESSELRPDSRQETTSETAGFAAALVIGTYEESNQAEVIFDTALMATWLIQSPGLDVNPNLLNQIVNVSKVDEIFTALNTLGNRPDTGGRLLVYLKGAIVERNAAMYFKLGNELPSPELDLDYLYSRVRQTSAYSSVLMVVDGKRRELDSNRIFGAISPTIGDDPMVPGLRIVALDWTRHEFTRAFIRGFAHAATGNTWLYSNELTDYLSKIKQIDVSIDGPERFILEAPQTDSSTRVRVLSRRSEFVCEHGSGRVILPTGDGPLALGELDSARIEGCVLRGETGRPCTSVIGVDQNGIGGMFGTDNTTRYVTEDVRVYSDGASARFDTVDDEDENYDDSHADVLLRKADYIDLIDQTSEFEQQPESQNMDLKWPLISLTIDLFGTRSGSSILIRRPRLERDTAILFDAGDQRSYREALQPRFEFLAKRKKQGTSAFQLDLLVISEMSGSNISAVSNILIDEIEREEDNRPPLIEIRNMWFNKNMEVGLSGEQVASQDLESEQELLSHIRRLEIERNPHFGHGPALRTRETPEIFEVNDLSITVLGPRLTEAGQPMTSNENDRLDQRGLILQIEHDNLKILLSGSASPETLLECLDHNPTHVDAMQLPQLPSIKALYNSESAIDELFNRVTADHYIVSDSSEDYQKTTLRILEQLLRSNQDSAFTVHFALHPTKFSADSQIEKIRRIFESHSMAKLSFPEPDSTHNTIDLMTILSKTT